MLQDGRELSSGARRRKVRCWQGFLQVSPVLQPPKRQRKCVEEDRIQIIVLQPNSFLIQELETGAICTWRSAIPTAPGRSKVGGEKVRETMSVSREKTVRVGYQAPGSRDLPKPCLLC